MTGSSEAGTELALLYEKQGGVATLTLNRPAARNALTAAMVLDMERILIEIEADDEIRVVVLTGAGTGFSAGADVKPVSKEERRRTQASSFPGDPGGDILDRGNRCILRLQRLSKPVLGSINGDAVGIGCSLALATDLRIGLVNRVVSSSELESTTFEWADRLASGPPLAYRAAKASVYEGRNLCLENALDLESRHQRVAGRSRDVKEGVRAFLEKRKPEFRGH